MINPTRRNRNIGTSKQGYGQNNKMVVPSPAVEMKSFIERLGDYRTIEKIINGHKFRFVVEKTRDNAFHACTIEDIEKIIAQIPKEDYGELELIILRQPTRKEEKLEPVWGRLIYAYEFENKHYPAIILEAISLNRTFKWPKKLSVDGQKELERLKKDGHIFKPEKRFHEAVFEIEPVRNTQLYRTLPHEFGHYVHYLEVVERPGSDDEEYETWEKRWEYYDKIPRSEKEHFAHVYADNFKKALEAKGVIPFDRMLNADELIRNNLNVNDFAQNAV